MKLGVSKTILGVHAVVLGVGILLSTLIYLEGRGVMELTEALAERNLPTLERLSDLKLAVLEQQAILHEYYATMDRETFLRHQAVNERRIEAGLAICRVSFPGRTELLEIENQYRRMRALGRQFDELINVVDIDWDQARAQLTAASLLSTAINVRVDGLVGAIRRQVAARAEATQDRIIRITGLVAFFSGTLFVVVVVVGYYVNAYLAEVAERRRLAMFPERNPNPVLSLALDGRVLYANAGARRMLSELGAETGRTEALFPKDLAARMARLRSASAESMRWEHPVAERVLECSIHVLEDLGVAHAYLTDITERKRAEERLVYQAYHDSLTGLPNRHRFMERCSEALGGAPKEGSAALLLLNLDRFKQVLDSLGHATGDRLIRAVAERLRSTLEACKDRWPGATLSRFEGHLFSLLLPRIGSIHGPVSVAEKLVGSMKRPLRVDGRELFATFSIGIAVSPHDGGDPITLLKNADTAAHAVKKRGGNGIQCYVPEMNAQALERLEMENALRRALERNELVLLYQPQFDIASGRPVGVEALLRWQRPGRGLVPPGDFTSLAEETGLIVPVGAWVLRTACAQAKAWESAGLLPLTMALNVSARQFHDEDLLEQVAGVLKETGLGPASLELEVTESAVMESAERTIAILRALKRIGVRLSLDDFGTGYSSLSYLRRFPLDKIKMDQSFVGNLRTEEGGDAAIARAVILLGHSLKLKVIAEGVETEAQLAFLRRHRCEEAQGYLFGVPMTAEALAARLRGYAGRPAFSA